MRTIPRLKVAGCALLLLLPSAAAAHNLVCEKNVNGERYIAVSQYPVTVTYDMHVINTDPAQASEVMSVDDPLLFNEGFRYTCGGFTLPMNRLSSRYFAIKLYSEEDCLSLAAADGRADSYIDNTFYATWDVGSTGCSARVICRPQCDQPPCVPTGVTRNAGFFQTHEQPLAACMQTPVDLGYIKLQTIAEALGVLWANSAVFPDGKPRSDLDRAKLLLTRQLLVATCNQRSFGSAIPESKMTIAMNVAETKNCEDYFRSEAALAEENDSGEQSPLPGSFQPGNATPVHAQDIARDPTQPTNDFCAQTGGTP